MGFPPRPWREGSGTTYGRAAERPTMTYRQLMSVAIIATVVVASGNAQTQERAAVDHAKHVLELLRSERFDDVAKEFNAQMATALPVEKLRDVWASVGQQFGALKSTLDERV